MMKGAAFATGTTWELAPAVLRIAVVGSMSVAIRDAFLHPTPSLPIRKVGLDYQAQQLLAMVFAAVCCSPKRL